MSAKAMFAAGCFWGVEAAIRQAFAEQLASGAIETAVGYSGGHLADPTYQAVCSGATGHAEVVEICFDPDQIRYDQLLKIFWQSHDPTTINQQGPDVGTQYRSAIFYADDQQKEAAIASKQAMDDHGPWLQPIVTEITAASVFYPAEQMHQQYFEKQGRAGGCHL